MPTMPNDVDDKNVTLLDLFATETNRAATFVATSLNAAQQFCGINVVVYFFPRVLAGDFGFTKTTAMAVAAAVSVAQVAFGALLARLRVVDRFGRKPSVLCGIAGLIFGLACLAFGAHERLPLLAVAGVAAFRLGFAASLGPLPYVVAAEVYSSSATRATGVSLATATQWACNALVSGTFLQMESSLGPTRVWLVYLAACVVAFVAVARFAPETKDARLE
jgi:SP family galactose:H+ symporter-like MFS transporter